MHAVEQGITFFDTAGVYGHSAIHRSQPGGESAADRPDRRSRAGEARRK
jgi:aryl-alcohol dehydrogenase-like predicted oxidoreductase